MESNTQPLIAFNAHLLTSEASYRSAGLSWYIVNLLRNLAQVDQPSHYRVLLGGGELPKGTDLPISRSRISTRWPAVRVLWEQCLLPLHLSRMQADVLHSPAFVGPLLAPCPQVITLHDLSFLRYPEFFKRERRLYLSTMTRIACRRAAAIITGSDFIAAEIISWLGVPAERVHTIYHGVAANFRPLPRDAVARFRHEKGLPEKFILHVGTLEPRKNLVRLVRAFARLPDTDVHLVLAGGRGWFYDEIFAEVESLSLVSRVHFPGYVAAEELSLWYNAASVFAYISLYEGFGLPILESLACGVPTLVALASSLPEVAGDGALLVPPDDEGAIADALQRLLTDEVLCEDLRQKGMAQARRFSWADTARRTMTVYRQVIKDS